MTRKYRTYNEYPFLDIPPIPVSLDVVSDYFEEAKRNGCQAVSRFDEFVWRFEEVESWFTGGKCDRKKQAKYMSMGLIGGNINNVVNRIYSIYRRAKHINCPPLIEWGEQCKEVIKKVMPDQIREYPDCWDLAR